MTGTSSRAGDTGPGGVPRTSPEALPLSQSLPLPLGHPQTAPVTTARGPAPEGPWSDPDAAFYTVGQVGDLLGVPAATLRRFDVTGAVRPARSTGGQRRYSHRQLEHARRLLRLVDEGLTLAAATRVADLEDTVADLRQQLSDTRSDDGAD
ncbi:MAG: hypothetical protein AVDCRST_MAG16-2621 [uncultured Frankineae bacterium]|uniref:HTH merR-type domain-containing protein n=1 Tax=uncultured Frankineae bacterium TaxID=437475 RepID=A0A6J4MCV9_9ACTN|nr:MAG: hypothetical protein AVDCRST_MAG16-2621 [uncultured Frankineae bacterium]